MHLIEINCLAEQDRSVSPRSGDIPVKISQLLQHDCPVTQPHGMTRFTEGKIMHNALILSALLLTSVYTSVVNANTPPVALSLLDLPIGEPRNATLYLLEQQWGSQADCKLMRTGMGYTRRAYFLETCLVINEHGNTLFNEIPTNAIYRFLEGQLIQVSYEFGDIERPDTFRRCTQQNAKALDAKTRDVSGLRWQGVSITEDFQVSVSDIEMVSQVHALRKTQ
ncbi:MAG: hypothetical protein AB8B64_22575 [Granulosicoccus sp.]